MKFAVYLIAAVLALFALIFIIGAQGQAMRFVIGIVLLGAAGVLIYLTRVQPKKEEITHVQKIDLTGDVHLEQMTCNSCHGTLSKENIVVKAGAIFVDCPYCGASYQIEEAPKW
ncbi:MAG TPA: hypothetical protein PLH19_14470 [Anaerolineae bacterium]|nr:hypothetical protein [Anaerolineae bacterium]HQH39722.1 hypothetical protein [Anaerolineae bacterium]